MSGTISLSWGPYGGIYLIRKPGFCVRLCFGWVALTWLAMDLDDVMEMAAGRGD